MAANVRSNCRCHFRGQPVIFIEIYGVMLPKGGVLLRKTAAFGGYLISTTIFLPSAFATFSIVDSLISSA